MSKTYLQRVARIPQLYKAWSHISDSTKSLHRFSTGIDGESVNQFAGKADHYLRQLSEALLSESGYSFSALKAHLEPKSSTEDRVICIPTVRDRIVQRAVLDVLSSVPKLSFESDVSYGFIKGRSVRKAVEISLSLRDALPWAYKTDISKFFDSLDRQRVHSEIRRRIRVPTLFDLLCRATNSEIKPRDNRQRKRIHRAGIRQGKGLRQGMPISPYLANLFLWEFDLDAIRNDFSMVRYADDLIFFASSRRDCEALHSFCENALGEIGLHIDSIGSGKTEIYEPKQSVEFLGISIDDSGAGYIASVPERKIHNCRSELLSLGNIDYLTQQKITISTLMQKMNGKISGWQEAYRHCANIESFTDALESSRRNAIESVFTKGLGMKSLTDSQRRFLEI